MDDARTATRAPLPEIEDARNLTNSLFSIFDSRRYFSRSGMLFPDGWAPSYRWEKKQKKTEVCDSLKRLSLKVRRKKIDWKNKFKLQVDVHQFTI